MTAENMVYKTRLVLQHLMNKKSITSWEAIEKYGATRLAAIVFILRQEGWNIQDEWVEEYDRYGKKSKFKKYFLGEPQKIGE